MSTQPAPTAPRRSDPRRFSRATAAAITAWALVLVGGMATLWVYAYRPAEGFDPPPHWPANTLVQPRPGRTTLLMAVHPKCPCTRASINELARIMRYGFGRADAHVLLFAPSGSDEQWAHTDLWASAEAIPGVAIHRDTDGAAAALFGTDSSGSVVLYDAQGRRRFWGGVTAGRGHEGPNSGQDAVVRLMQGLDSALTTSPVYGCRIHDDSCDGVCPPRPPGGSGI